MRTTSATSDPGFIEVDNRSRVRIAHYSVQEYLESDRILTGKTARFGVRRVDANTEVALICVAYLMDGEWYPMGRKWSNGTSVTKINEIKRPLARYALDNWPRHYREGNGSDPRLHSLTLQFFHDDRLTRTCMALMPQQWKDPYMIGAAPLSFVASLGIDPIVRALASASPALARHKNSLELAMVAAARYGRATTVKLLLDHGADINYPGVEGTALHAAAKRNHIKIVEMLLRLGASMEIQQSIYGSPLYCAAQAGHENVIALHLDRGANLNLGGRGSPLEATVSPRVTELLISRGADINFGKHETPLEKVCRGHDRFFSDVVGNGQHGIPLPLWQKEVDQRQLENLHLLLDHGADVNLGKRLTPLEAAAWSGYTDAVKILLDRGADPNLGIRMTPWQTAMREGHHELAQLLVARMAPVSEVRAMAQLGERLKRKRVTAMSMRRRETEGEFQGNQKRPGVLETKGEEDVGYSY